MSKRKKSSGPFLLALMVVGLGAVGYGAGPGGWFKAEEVQALEGVPVRRGDLRISEITRGNLEAKNSAKLVNELEGRTTVIYLIEEGTTVNEGELVCELDVSDMRDKRIDQEIDVKNAEAAYTKAKEQYDIQEIQNESDIANAKLELKLAGLDQQKFVEEQGGEKIHQLAQAEESIKIAEEELKQADNALTWTKKLHEKGFAQRTELERDQLSLERAKINIEQARREKTLMENFEHQKTLAELEAAVATAEREVKKVEKQALARLVDYEAERESQKFELERQRDQLARIDDQLGKAKMYAPIEGMVIYARKKSRYGGGEVPEEGGEVHERQEIIHIPRTGGMTADVSLHETKLENVRPGLACRVIVDAIPGQTFQGNVAYVSQVADSGSWMSNPNQRLYKTEVTMTETVPEMRPGMSCEIEILIDDLEDVLYVPRQSVFLDGGGTVCFVAMADAETEVRKVVVGQDSNSWAQIESGLAQGDMVLLSPPASWEPTPADTKAPAGDFGEQKKSDEMPERTEGSKGDGGSKGSKPRSGSGVAGASSYGSMTDEQRKAAGEKYKSMSEEDKAKLRAKYSAQQQPAGGSE